MGDVAITDYMHLIAKFTSISRPLKAFWRKHTTERKKPYDDDMAGQGTDYITDGRWKITHIVELFEKKIQTKKKRQRRSCLK